MLSCIDSDKKGYEPIYRGSVKRGNPEKIKFHIKRTPLGVARDLELHRGSSEKRLCAKLISLYPTLDEERLKAFVADVPEDLWNDFKMYAYNGVPKAVEQPHRWNGTPEDFIFYIMDQWIKQRQHKVEIEQELPLFANTESVMPGQKEWDAFLSSYTGAFLLYVQPLRLHTFDGTNLVLCATNAQREAFETYTPDDVEHEMAVFKQALKKAFGRPVRISYYLTDK